MSRPAMLVGHAQGDMPGVRGQPAVRWLMRLGAVGSVVLLAGSASAAAPPPHARFASNCASFSTAHAVVAFGGTRTREQMLRLHVYMNDDGVLVGDDPFFRVRYRWEGGEVFSRSRAGPKKALVRGAGGVLGTLWSECRAGFSNSVWTAESPADAGYSWPERHNVTWARLDLPAAWAPSAAVYVGLLVPGASQPEIDSLGRVKVVAFDQAGLLFSGVVAELDWNSSTPPSTFVERYPSEFPPPPEYWNWSGH